MVTNTAINVITVPAFHDNYLWLFHIAGQSSAYIVDPGDAVPVLQALRDHQLQLEGILITHHHPDHTGGIDALLKHHKVPVYGPAGGSVAQVSHPLKEGDRVNITPELTFEVLAVPGHTLDHIAYFADPGFDAPLLFCGDTLFAGGCGRLFEGSAAQMYESLNKFARLPGATRVYCAHEYTLSNLAFAKAVESDNTELLARIEQAQATRDQGLPTVPTTIDLEKATNPFMRSQIASVKLAAERHSGQPLPGPAEVLGAIRRWKDQF